MHLEHIEIDGIVASIEFNSVKAGMPGRQIHVFDSYNARLTWNHRYEGDFLVNFQQEAKSFGNYDAAVVWILSELENTSHFLLKNSQ